jgi:short-subunit dehydrogenase
MPTNHNLKGRWALITGASSGLGTEFARELAARGCNVVLVARREDRLRELEREIASSGVVKAHVVAMDLCEQDAPERLRQALQREGIAIDLLVNNAGIGFFGRVLDVAWEKDRDTIVLNILALVQLTRLFAKDMVARGFGHILQVASTGAFQPDPSMATYGASKAFVLSFGEAMAFELHGTEVTCTVLSPGYTDTEFHQAGSQPMTWFKRMMMMDSRKVARIGVEAMLRGRRSVVAGFANAIMAWSTRLFPRRLTTWMSHRILDPSR